MFTQPLPFERTEHLKKRFSMLAQGSIPRAGTTEGKTMRRKLLKTGGLVLSGVAIGYKLGKEMMKEDPEANTWEYGTNQFENTLAFLDGAINEWEDDEWEFGITPASSAYHKFKTQFIAGESPYELELTAKERVSVLQAIFSGKRGDIEKFRDYQEVTFDE